MGIHDNKIAIVTGGAQGIGRGIVDVLSSEGAKVCVADISKEHGESAVNQINENGGSIKETYGVPINEIQEGIKNGVRKINIDTDLRLASTAAIRKHFYDEPAQFDPRKYLLDSKDAMKVIVKQRLEEFGTAGNASKIKPTSLSVMSKHYAEGKLSQIIS